MHWRGKYLEAEFKVCLLVSALGESLEKTVAMKSLTIIVLTVFTQAIAYYYLDKESKEILFLLGQG